MIIISSHAGVIDPNTSNQQVLDRLPVERERGITVKAQTATMFYQMQREGMFMMNLIDTPVSGFLMMFMHNYASGHSH